MEGPDLKEALIQWVSRETDILPTLAQIRLFADSSSATSSYADLADLFLVFRVLNFISPKYFPLGTDPSDGEALLAKLRQFFEKELLCTGGFPDCDMKAIMSGESTSHMIKFLQLILAAAVRCKKRDSFIEKIMELPNSVQAQLMVSIESTLSSISFESDVEEEDNHSQLLEENNYLKLELSEHEKKIKQLEKEKKELVAAKLDAETLSPSVAGGGVKMSRENRVLKARLKELEKFLETKEMESAQMKDHLLEDASRYKQSIRALQDELDLMQSQLSEKAALEPQLESCRMKLAEIPKLRRQIKEYQEESTQSIEEVVALRASVKALEGLKSQNTVYKARVVDLEATMTQQKAQMELLSQENIRIKRQTSTEIAEMAEERRVLLAEVEELRRKIESLEAKEEEEGSAETGERLAAGQQVLTPDIERRLRMLEMENAALQQKLEDAGNVDLVKSQLDDARLLVSRLQNDKVSDAILLEEQRQGLAELQQNRDELRSCRDELERAGRTIKELNEKRKKAEVYCAKNAEHFELLKQRMKKTALAEKFLKAELESKTEECDFYSKSFKTQRRQHKMEHQLIMSCFYEAGHDMHLQLMEQHSKQQKQGSVAVGERRPEHRRAVSLAADPAGKRPTSDFAEWRRKMKATNH